ncbi:hypothetical protein ES332_D02G154200v1 [Gossypium tomentosum]|uniref:Uncharacterized protein n=1 Tax=Gossypium tomentosum TaxID=34277 RepID=A0A5D2LXJ0_GOSTO|nr:hypothetical protein ES332_D02G154200v1 [Gossypium tomentosum]
MTLLTSSLFPLTTPLPLLAFSPLFSRKSAMKMVSTDGLTARFSCSYTDAEPQQDIYGCYCIFKGRVGVRGLSF